MSKIFLFFLFVILSVFAKSQTSYISGEWLNYKVVSTNDTTAPYFILELSNNGKIKIFGLEFGEWSYNAINKSIFFKSQTDKDFNGNAKILKLNHKELIIKKESTIYYYSKINQEKINSDNKRSNIFGIWEMETSSSEFMYIKFSEPNKFNSINNFDGVTTRNSGQWIYNPADSSIIIIALQSDFRGLSKIKFHKSHKISIIKKNAVFDITKLVPDARDIERLTFTEEDFENIDLNEEQNKLPWRDFELMVERLAKISEIVLARGTLIEDFDILTYDYLLSKIKVDNEKETVTFSNKILNQKDTIQYSENYKGGLSERYNDFFPNETPVYFRVVGKDTILVPAGQFYCTIVEAIDGFKKVKYWMIDKLSGIYAKTIIETKDVLGNLQYTKTELLMINR